MRRMVVAAALSLAWAGNAVAQTNSLADIAARDDAQQLESLVLGGATGIDGLDSRGGHTPLDYAASFDDDALAQFLLAHDASVDARDTAGETALDWAAQRGSIDVMRTLIAAKADVNAQNEQGQTPLMLAVAADNPAAVRLLLEHGADPKKQDYTGRDAFGWAEGEGAALQALNDAR